MADYTKTRLNAQGRTDQTCDFIGWSDLDGVSDEATNADDLYLPMGPSARRIFESLEPGQTKTVAPFQFFRQ